MKVRNVIKMLERDGWYLHRIEKDISFSLTFSGNLSGKVRY